MCAILLPEINERLLLVEKGKDTKDMTTYGYCRVSTPQQSLERQERNIASVYPQAHIISEAWTGTEMNRPAWMSLMRKVKQGDVIVFDSVSRMSRTADEGINAYMDLMKKGITLVFLKEPYINTKTYQQAMNSACLPTISTGQASTDNFISKVLEAVEDYIKELAGQQIMIAFEQAEKEVQDLRQRTREGIETARKHGAQIGRPQGTGKTFATKKEHELLPRIEKMSKDFKGVMNDSEIIETLHISKNTYYKYKRKLREHEME